jgi:hypothetical protein
MSEVSRKRSPRKRGRTSDRLPTAKKKKRRAARSGSTGATRASSAPVRARHGSPKKAPSTRAKSLLTRGVGIVLEQAGARGSPIEFSSGSIRIGSPLYQAGAIVPRGPWGSIPASELKKIAGPKRGESKGNTIRVVRFPAAFLHRVHELVRGAGESTREGVALVVGGPAGREILREFRQYALSAYGLKLAICPGKIQGGFSVRGQDLETVSANPASGLRIGLHVDGWFRMPVDRRAQAPVRLCANFGWNDRFLLFLNISVNQLASGEIGEFAGRIDEQIRKKSVLLKSPMILVREFLTAFPDYPIGRIRIRPGEAYLAPTENLAHDGSSVSSAAPDITCHIHVH